MIDKSHTRTVCSKSKRTPDICELIQHHVITWHRCRPRGCSSFRVTNDRLDKRASKSTGQGRPGFIPVCGVRPSSSKSLPMRSQHAQDARYPASEKGNERGSFELVERELRNDLGVRCGSKVQACGVCHSDDIAN